MYAISGGALSKERVKRLKYWVFLARWTMSCPGHWQRTLAHHRRHHISGRRGQAHRRNLQIATSSSADRLLLIFPLRPARCYAALQRWSMYRIYYRVRLSLYSVKHLIRG